MVETIKIETTTTTTIITTTTILILLILRLLPLPLSILLPILLLRYLLLIPPSRRPTRFPQTGRVSSLTLAAWNVRSLLGNPMGNRPERRTALVARELARYKLDIAALSVTRFSEQGQLDGHSGPALTYWTPSDQLHLSDRTNRHPSAVSSSSSSSPPSTNCDCSSDPPLPSSPSSYSHSSSSFSSTAPTSAALPAVAHNNTHIPDTTTDITPATSDSRGEDQDYTCPHCDRTFTSHIGLVGHLRIHRTEAGEPVPRAPIYTHRPRLHCPHCPRTFMHRMGLFGHMRTHDSGINIPPDSPTTPNPNLSSSPCAPTIPSATDTDATDFTCPHCPRTFTFRIGLVGHLQIQRTETGELVPGAPT
ncbi:hypothetical protein SprV_0702258900 [Sparganum proliferum]